MWYFLLVSVFLSIGGPERRASILERGRSIDVTCQSGIVAPRDLGILRNKSIYFVFFCLFYLCFVACSKFFNLVMPIKIL